jgi:hypothetical protein
MRRAQTDNQDQRGCVGLKAMPAPRSVSAPLRERSDSSRAGYYVKTEIYPGDHASEFQPPSGRARQFRIARSETLETFGNFSHRRPQGGRHRSDRSQLHALVGCRGATAQMRPADDAVGGCNGRPMTHAGIGCRRSLLPQSDQIQTVQNNVSGGSSFGSRRPWRFIDRVRRYRCAISLAL